MLTHSVPLFHRTAVNKDPRYSKFNSGKKVLFMKIAADTRPTPLLGQDYHTHTHTHTHTRARARARAHTHTHTHTHTRTPPPLNSTLNLATWHYVISPHGTD